MIPRFPACAVFLAALCAAAPAAAKGGSEDAAKVPIARRVEICNSAGVEGVQYLTPFLTVPRSVDVSDSTEKDTVITSSPAWMYRPLYRLAKGRESRIDIEGPTDLVVITLAPFLHAGVGFKMDYALSVHLDGGDPQRVDLHTQRSNPLYTAHLRGTTFGIPKAFLVAVPGGKHSVYVTAVDGPFDFCFATFQEARTPAEELRK
ncbi:MAG TPA: hypothetical protein VMS93_12250 [Candidatus Saccharimonadales bacterium]|nr:hypothetical protein [Candidatus Saccharimonadales bacterium]